MYRFQRCQRERLAQATSLNIYLGDQAFADIQLIELHAPFCNWLTAEFGMCTFES